MIDFEILADSQKFKDEVRGKDGRDLCDFPCTGGLKHSRSVGQHNVFMSCLQMTAHSDTKIPLPKPWIDPSISRGQYTHH